MVLPYKIIVQYHNLGIDVDTGNTQKNSITTKTPGHSMHLKSSDQQVLQVLALHMKWKARY